MKSKKIIIMSLLVTLVISLLFSIGSFGYFYFKDSSIKKACEANRNTLQEASKNYLNTQLSSNPAIANFPSSLDKILGDTEAEIICPEGGNYMLDPINGIVFCTVEGHD